MTRSWQKTGQRNPLPALHNIVPNASDGGVLTKRQPSPARLFNSAFIPSTSSECSLTLSNSTRDAFARVDKAPGVTPDMIRGYGGAKVDRYDTQFPPDKFNVAAVQMAKLDDGLKSAILKKAGQR